MQVIWVWEESKYFWRQDWTSSISLIRLDNSPPARSTPSPRGAAQSAAVEKIRDKHRRLGDSESFNQLVRTIPRRTRGCVMSNLDRVSGSFLAIIVGGLAILCGGLIVIVIGY
jgi:hypothetical protein